MQPASKKHLKPVLGATFAALFIVGTVLWSNRKPTQILKPTTLSIFSENYPNDSAFISEIELLKSQGKLKQKDEKQIRTSIEKTCNSLNIPKALLYCLFFQESRLNHLSGMESEETTLGLGQFSYYSFFEINHQISVYTPKNLSALQKILGYDVRPILAKSSDPSDPSSYFNIPTAVAASAIYLNNRYHHLLKLTEKKQIQFDKNLLWIMSAMAYNKGTRSVLSLWNQTEEKNGVNGLNELLSDPKIFFSNISNDTLLSNSLNRIWPKKESEIYAREWGIHAKNIIRCSVDTDTLMKNGIN